MPFGISAVELIALLLVCLLIFGASRLPEIGRSLGQGLREFRGVAREVESLDEASRR